MNNMTEEEFKNNGLIIGIEDISTKIKWGLNALYCVYTAMVEGDCAPESYTDGLFFVYDCLDRTADDLEKYIGALREQIRRETK